MGALLGYAAALAIHLTPTGSSVGAVLLNMAVFGAALAYVLQMASFLALRWGRGLQGRSPWSPDHAIRNADYHKGVIGVAVWFAPGIAYFAAYARKRLVLAPEEAAAMRHQKEEQA